MEECIASHVTRCLGLFSNSIDASERTLFDLPVSFTRDVRDQQTRFKVWSGNIGAHRTGMSSLDHRLRDSSHSRNQVGSLLRDLTGLLDDAVAIITGEESSWDQLSGDEGIVPSEVAEDSESPNTELDQISVDFADVVNCLLHECGHPKSRTSRSLYRITPTVTSHYEPFNIQHIYSKFESIDSELAEKLGKAISRRRQYFKYRMVHLLQNRMR
ncbi:hypothetical protein B0J13DRAFT_616516 [Dactylonectria estremocensis]|uniref:Uncharacterized protein n=1 Tax=Dactylonectria estremocensis TaxID=1079267 RepID=A0A9P9FD81_9HYPO|nr:hypothetical protein B0J13DRAFT_616516 [Dactylonectria estremocensis]